MNVPFAHHVLCPAETADDECLLMVDWAAMSLKRRAIVRRPAKMSCIQIGNGHATLQDTQGSRCFLVKCFPESSSTVNISAVAGGLHCPYALG